MGRKTPDLTPAQIAAIAGSVIGVATAYGAPLPAGSEQDIVSTVQILAPTLIGSDALLRFGRQRYLGEKILEHKDEPRPPRPVPHGALLVGVAASGVLIGIAALIVALT